MAVLVGGPGVVLAGAGPVAGACTGLVFPCRSNFAFKTFINHCETRTGVIDNGKDRKLKITTYKVVFQTVEINNIFSRRKFQ